MPFRYHDFQRHEKHDIYIDCNSIKVGQIKNFWQGEYDVGKLRNRKYNTAC